MADILVIDDEEQVRTTLARQLERAMHKVTLAPHGRLGLELLAQQPFALVICDIVMPEFEGLEFLIAQRRAGDSTPVIAITGGSASFGGRSVEVDYLAMAQKFGAAFVLRKPFTQSQLLTLVDAALEARGN